MASDDTEQNWRKYARLPRPSSKRVRLRARKLEGATLRHAHRFIVSRWANLKNVRRHAIGWVVLASLLVVVTSLQLMLIQNTYQSRQPVSGGTYAEGVVGRVDTLNPIYASTQSERSASALIFSSLLRYNDRNQLENDLAAGYTRSDDGRVYTVTLRSDALWHDGQRVTADDVVFTLGLIKNPVTRSYLYRTWQDVQVKKLDRYVVQFTLPSAYAPFTHALTFGIVPRHVLETISPARTREHTFNREPIGSGPLVFRSIQVIDPDADRVVVQMMRNEKYYRGTLKIERFQLHTYKSHDELRQGFLSREINAAHELTKSDIQTVLKEAPLTRVVNAPLNDGVYAFLRTDSPVLMDVAVRRALVKAVDKKEMIKKFDGLAGALNGPLVDAQVSGGVSDLRQDSFDLDSAAADLEKAGWVLNDKNKIREKNGQKLQLSVVAPESGDFAEVMSAIAASWRRVGVDVRTQLVETSTFEQNILKGRAYDVLIYELALGADSDIFAYWHSSQASVRGFNLSNYKSGIADDALISARARVETDLRTAKYRAFVSQWISDAPAVALYQPRLHYVTTDDTSAMNPDQNVIDSINRYHDIANWTVLKADQFKTP